MTQVSKYPISKDIADRIFDVFIKSLIKVKDAKVAENLANDLFSPTERIMFAKRLAIAFLLTQEYQYREISRLLRVSLATIASVQLSLRYGRNGYATVLKSIAKEEKLKDFFLDISEKLLMFPGQVSKGGGIYRNLRYQIQKTQKKRTKQLF